MAKETTPGIILYPEDINRIKRCVKPQYQFAVIYALAQYATDGVMPTIDDLGEGGMVAFEFVFDKVRSALDSYEKGRKQRQDAIRKRWDTEEYEKPQNDTTVYDRIRPNQTEPKTETETETETKRVVVVEDAPAAESVIAIDGKRCWTKPPTEIRGKKSASTIGAPSLRTNRGLAQKGISSGHTINPTGIQSRSNSMQTAIQSLKRGANTWSLQRRATRSIKQYSTAF